MYLFKIFKLLSVAGFFLATGCTKNTAIDNSYKILVDFGQFNSVGEAASAEHKIDWSGNDFASMSACTESFAAQELRNHLCKLLQKDAADISNFQIVSLKDGVPLKAILLGNLLQTDSDNKIAAVIKENGLNEKLLQAESFAIVPKGENLFIIGQNRVGTLYGIYQLLESFGVRWYAPGEIGEIIPVVKQLKMPTQTIVQAPKFITRGFWAWEDRGNRDFYLWMARNRLNFWTIAEPDRPFLRKLGIQLTVGGHLHFDRFLNPDDEYPFNHPKFKGDENKPADPYVADSPEHLGDANHDGKLTYYEAHPEWYGFFKGKRRTFKGDFGMNICTSNQDVVNELCRKLVNDLASGEWRDASTLNFWPIDGGDWCECENCKPLASPTDRLLVLVHQVRRAIVKAMENGEINRNVKVIFPIYHETLPPPTRPLPKNFDYENCIGTFFPIRRCYVHFLDDSTCTEFNTRIWGDFLGWTKKEPRYYRGQIFMGEYFNVSKIKSLPVLYTRIMAHDIPLYYDYGTRHHHYMHVYTGLMGMKRINNYLFARLLWEPQTDVKSLLDEYFDNFYGSASKRMALLYDRLEFAMSSIKQWKHTKPLTSQIYNDKEPLFNLEHLKLKEYHPEINDGVDLEESVFALKECRQIMDEVLANDLSEVIKQRLLEDDKNLRYAENTVNFYYYVVQAIQAKREGDREKAKEFYRASIPYAKELKAETEILQTSSTHANAKDGLEASRIEKTYLQLGEELGGSF